ncbi:MAG: sortase [Lachnospiraceae bacterium]|nr:sortase [Lachnospiraceae bacterium]
MNQIKKFVAIMLACIAIGCLIVAGVITLQYMQEDIESGEALSTGNSYQVSAENIATAPPSPTPIATETPTLPLESTPEPIATPSITSIPAIANPYTDSYLANSDMVGWLQIPGTVIDYPIMWTPADENYYLYRDFNKKDNKNGCLILDTDSSLDPLTTNLIIHGHNMKSGAMFGDLTEYEDKDYYEEHKQIVLHTRECQRNYEIIAVFRSQVFKKTDTVFKFYKFFQADTEAEFNDFYENIKKLSLYDTGVTAEFGDNFITLSTCVYHVTNGRFVVVAKEVEPGDYYLPLE